MSFRLQRTSIVDKKIIIVMDPSSFDNIKRAVQSKSFKDEKLNAIRSTLPCSYGYLSGEQVAQLVQEFPFDDDRLTVVEICAPRMYSLSCQQAATIMGVFSFDKSKTKALELIAGHINDNNLSALDSVLSFSSDRDRAREILMNRSAMGQPPRQPGLPPQPGPQPFPGTGGFPGAGGFPGMPPQLGGYPTQSPFPGAPPYGAPSPYPAPGPYGGYPGAASPQYPMGTAPPPTGAPYGAPPPGGYYPPAGGFPPQGYPYQPR